jgi:hypothetical protein
LKPRERKKTIHRFQLSPEKSQTLKYWWVVCRVDSQGTKSSKQPGWPDWANFRLLGDGLLWIVFWRGPNFRATFFHGKSCVLLLTKGGLGYILGYFFTNLSGHNAKNWEPERAEIGSIRYRFESY